MYTLYFEVDLSRSKHSPRYKKLLYSTKIPSDIIKECNAKGKDCYILGRYNSFERCQEAAAHLLAQRKRRKVK